MNAVNKIKKLLKIKVTFDQKVNYLMSSLNLSQPKVACLFGVTPNSLKRICDGEAIPKSIRLENIYCFIYLTKKALPEVPADELYSLLMNVRYVFNEVDEEDESTTIINYLCGQDKRLKVKELKPLIELIRKNVH